MIVLLYVIMFTNVGRRHPTKCIDVLCGTIVEHSDGHNDIKTIQ